jgi:ABC-type sugar transport system ATPase subunit
LTRFSEHRHVSVHRTLTCRTVGTPESLEEETLMPSEAPAVFLQARELSKTFGHVRALRDVSLEIHENDILAIVGDNGAGKSTLTKILSGVYQPDRGDIRVKGEPVRIANPRKARELGIATVFQNLALVDCRDVAANLFLGREPTRWRFLVDRRKMLADSREVITRLRVTIPSLTVEAGQLSGGQRQSIAIGRAASQNARVIIMDEPTAALGVKESRKVLDLILQLRAHGTTVVVISHNMRHVFSVADRILVLRHGQVVGVRRKQETTPDEIVKMIVGVETL